MYDYVVVGGGIGGVMSAALLSKNKKTLLIEKEPYLGGCASTFSKKGYSYNAGATTFAMYEKGFVVHDIFERIGFRPDIKELEFSHIVIQNGHRVKRYQDLRRFLEELNKAHYHPKNEEFWRLVKTVCDDFYRYESYRYSNKNILSKLISYASFAPLAVRFAPYFLQNAREFIKRFFGRDISDSYISFLDAQTIIAAQADTSKLNFLTAALALGYSFSKNYYPNGGMGAIVEGIASKIGETSLGERVEGVEKIAGGYRVFTNKDRAVETKNVLLNTTVFGAAKLFGRGRISSYFEAAKRVDSGQSAFVVYMRVKTKKEYAHHYQIIEKTKLAYTISNSVFVSFSDRGDAVMSKEGALSVTASIHTKASFWETLDKEGYKNQKERLKRDLTALICDKLGIDKEEIVDSFAATPMTFERYICRKTLGGTVMSSKNQINLYSNDTPFAGLYVVGDTSFAAQGWPGVAMGVRNLLCTM